ncbi:acetylglutamate kinase [Rufibacter sp. DG15C]|uniref:acetylglutamate kinase n=1 Tax=Rufibacter sp. DG15C TaxID=1379909 RepID=UPI00078DC385|nr:acetylglutamate kinase [Rufibacter sp. DG15C]AMM51557.1 acetylglutamate kinase [Rufibacter sp. DG15C]
MPQKISVIKIGGNVLDNADNLERFLTDFSLVPGLKVLVHGGGTIASEIGKKMGIEPMMINGRRVTDANTLHLVTMVYGGLLNKNLVAQLQARKCNALGLTGADANVIPAHKRPVKDVNYGFVGDVESPDQVNVAFLASLAQQGIVPVFAALTHDGEGSLLNTNADTIASTLAVALSRQFEVNLVYCFEKKGVLLNVEDETSVIHHLQPESYATLKEKGAIFAGMLPKLDNAFAALQQGVNAVIIGDSADILGIAAGEKAGTKITL